MVGSSAARANLRPGQVRDINSFTLGALVEKTGGEAIRYGIFSDSLQVLKEAAARALGGRVGRLLKMAERMENVLEESSAAYDSQWKLM